MIVLTAILLGNRSLDPFCLAKLYPRPTDHILYPHIPALWHYGLDIMVPKCSCVANPQCNNVQKWALRE